MRGIQKKGVFPHQARQGFDAVVKTQTELEHGLTTSGFGKFRLKHHRQLGDGGHEQSGRAESLGPPGLEELIKTARALLLPQCKRLFVQCDDEPVGAAGATRQVG